MEVVTDSGGLNLDEFVMVMILNERLGAKYMSGLKVNLDLVKLEARLRKYKELFAIIDRNGEGCIYTEDLMCVAIVVASHTHTHTHTHSLTHSLTDHPQVPAVCSIRRGRGDGP